MNRWWQVRVCVPTSEETLGLPFFSHGDLWLHRAGALASDDVDRDDVFWRRVEWSTGAEPRFVDAPLCLASRVSLLMGIQIEQRFKTRFSRRDGSGRSA